MNNNWKEVGKEYPIQHQIVSILTSDEKEIKGYWEQTPTGKDFFDDSGNFIHAEYWKELITDETSAF